MKKQYNFELPKITDLTIEQQVILYEDNPVAIFGGAGTGKTVVSIYRHLDNYKQGKKSIIITFTKTLQRYIFLCVKAINIEASKKVHSANGCLIPKHKDYCTNNIDEIIIDEAQDLEFDVISTIKNFSKNISYGADFNQQLYKNRITQNEIQSFFSNNEEFTLESNYRNTEEIISFTKAIMPKFKINVETQNSGEKPIVFVGDNQINQVIDIINTIKEDGENFAILLPFAYQVDKYFNVLKNKINCSCYHHKIDENSFDILDIHITTFKSSKGLEFDTIIIPEFQDYQKNIETKDFVNYNDYYVAFTRAKNNLFLISSVPLDIDKNRYEMEEF